MKFSVNRQGFLKNLVDVQRAIPSKTTIPILTGIKLVASEEGLTLTGSDSEVSIEVFLPIEDEELRRRMGQAAKVNSQRFSLDNVMKLWEDLFAELMAK